MKPKTSILSHARNKGNIQAKHLQDERTASKSFKIALDSF